MTPAAVTQPGRLPGADAAAWKRPEVWVTVLLVVCDQLTKWLVLQRIPLHDTVTVIPGLLNLTYVRNTGAAFGMLNAQRLRVQAAGRRRSGDPRAARHPLVRAEVRRRCLAGALRVRADRRRRGRQPDRPRDARLRRGLRRRVRSARGISGRSTSPTRRSPSGRSCSRPTPCSRGAMFPKLFDLGPLTVYSYGVLLAAAYLGGLQFALVRARKRGLDAARVMDLGIYIIVSALVGAKLLLVIVDADHFLREPARPAVAGPLGRRVLRRADPRRAGRALVRAQAPAADVAHRRRDRAGHRVRPRRRPARLLPGGLLLRPRDRPCRGP